MKHEEVSDRREAIEQVADGLERLAGALREIVKAESDGERYIELLERVKSGHEPQGTDVTLFLHPDDLALVVQGLRKAVAGDADPFDLREPRGIKPRLSRQERIEAVARVLLAIDDGQLRKDAIERVAKDFNVSGKYLERDLADATLRRWAQLLVIAARKWPSLRADLESAPTPQKQADFVGGGIGLMVPTFRTSADRESIQRTTDETPASPAPD